MDLSLSQAFLLKKNLCPMDLSFSQALLKKIEKNSISYGSKP